LVALRKALAGYPLERRHFVQSQFGHLYWQKGDFRRAKDWFRKTIESAPSEASGYIYLGAVLAQEGRFAEAEKIHGQGTQCTTGCIDEAYFNLGLVLRAQGRLSEALDCFRKALEIEPKDKSVKRALSDVSRAMKLKGLG
jgi:tetratricopeptide (TPR) repeat protein